MGYHADNRYHPIDPSYNSGYEDGRKASKEKIKDLELANDEYRDTIAQQAELLAAHKAEMQDWQREMLKAQQQRDELLEALERLVEKHRSNTLFDNGGHWPQAREAIAKVKP